MRIIINANCPSIPQDFKPLVSHSNALLNLLGCFDYDLNAPPLADLLRTTHHLEGKWLVLSPVHWEATHNDAMITAYGKELDLTPEQSSHWFSLYANFLAEEGLILKYHDAEHWLLNTPNLPPLTAKPVHQLVHKSLMPELKHLDSSLFWQKFITESQMFFASLPNDTVLNGVWPWGDAQLSAKKPITICTDEAFFEIAQSLSSQVTLYNPSVLLKSFQIILINDLTSLSSAHCKELNTLSAQIYWNNCAYIQSRSWFSRLWRT